MLRLCVPDPRTRPLAVDRTAYLRSRMAGFGSHEPDDAADDREDRARGAQREEDCHDSQDDVDDPARTVLAAVDEQASHKDRDPKEGRSEEHTSELQSR